MNHAVYLVVVVVFLSGIQNVLAQTTKNILGSWVVVVDNESRTRTLQINKAIQGKEGTFESEYGWTDSKKSPTEVRFTTKENGQKNLVFTTGAGSKVDVDEIGIASFEGRITNTGYDKKVTIISVENAKQNGLLSEQPGLSVPTHCASFYGLWRGWWAQGGIPEQIIHITQVNEDCFVKFSYYENAKYPGNYLGTSKIVDGKFSFVCNKETNGTCTFGVHGDELWVSYSNPGGGNNSAVFKKQ